MKITVLSILYVSFLVKKMTKNVKHGIKFFLSRVGHLGPTLDTVMGFFASFFMNFGRFEWNLIAVFGSF